MTNLPIIDVIFCICVRRSLWTLTNWSIRGSVTACCRPQLVPTCGSRLVCPPAPRLASAPCSGTFSATLAKCSLFLFLARDVLLTSSRAWAPQIFPQELVLKLHIKQPDDELLTLQVISSLGSNVRISYIFMGPDSSGELPRPFFSPCIK